MNSIVLEQNQIIDFELLTYTGEQHIYNYLVIYFVLEGNLTVTMESVTIKLKEKDFLFINAFRSHTLKMSDDALVMEFAVNLDLLSSYYDISQMEFVGNSTEGEQEQYRSFRTLMENCVVYYYGKCEKDGRILLKLNSLYYQMAEKILTFFAVVRNEKAISGSSDEVLMQDMLRYIQMNYQSSLKLEELANRFYLSASYISRLFKKKIGINFGKYLEEIRLDAAEKKLENSQESLTRIAMDCGFPNLTSFNKVFREKYGMSPKEYRGQDRNVDINDSNDVENHDMTFRLLDYFEQHSMNIEDESELIEKVEADTQSYTYMTKSWNRIINIGRVPMLLQTAVQSHVLFLKEELNFEYVRIWDIYDPDLRIHVEDKTRKYNFTRLDMAFDFLVGHHLKPYIEMGFKPNILLDAHENYTYYEERQILFENGESYGSFFRSLLVHLINRYGIREVSDWCFEQWCDPRLFFAGNPDKYFEFFEHAYQVVKAIAPNVKIGGDYDRTYGVIDFETFICRWSKRNIQPDFISLYCYPAAENEVDTNFRVRSIQNLNQKSLCEYLQKKRDILMKYGMIMPLYISEWSFTVINYNVLNDSCFKGAYIMQNIMEMHSYADAMGYWFGSDLFAEGDDPLMLLNGRCGLVTHQRIGKPAFWAMKFMNRLESCLLMQSEHAMVTMDEFHNYVIVCHNCRPLDIQYYVQEERDITLESIPNLFTDKKQLLLTIQIKGMKDGLYHVKTRKVNSEYGSVQDEWIQMGKASFLNQRDIDYMNYISRPRITISEQSVTDGTICLTAELQAQEIRCIHLFRYTEEDD